VSTLGQSLAERRAADPAEPAYASAPAGTGSLLVHLWSGESWVFPWSQFVDARLTGESGAEELILAFARRAVAVRGRYLRRLLPEIAGFRIESLRGLPPEYRPPASAGEPFIEDVRVLPLSEFDAPSEEPR
jgi:hypothetical protein